MEDCIVLPSGARAGMLNNVFKPFVEVSEAQIHQKDRMHLVVSIVKMPGYTMDTERRILQEFRSRLGDEIGIAFRYCDKVPRTRAGKLKFVTSEVV